MPKREGARRGRQGLQGRDRDAERRAHRHRRADARARRAARSSTRSATRRSGSSSARRSPSSRACSSSSRAPRRSVEAARLHVYNAARLRDAGRPFLTEAAMCKIFVVGGRRARRVARRQSLRRQRLRQGLPGREALPRREDRPDLRGHVESAAADDREADSRLTRCDLEGASSTILDGCRSRDPDARARGSRSQQSRSRNGYSSPQSAYSNPSSQIPAYRACISIQTVTLVTRACSAMIIRWTSDVP